MAIMKASNKKRVYLAVYPSHVEKVEEKLFHWAILVGPKVEREEDVKGRRYAVVPIKTTDPAKPAGWKYDEGNVPDIKTGSNLLARVLIAKIEDEGRFHQIVRETPVHTEPDQWSCRLWISDVLRRLDRDENGAVGTSVLSWPRIEPLVQKYVATKAENGVYSRPGVQRTSCANMEHVAEP